MNFLINFDIPVCETPDILRIIHLALKIMDLLFIVIPIALILMITIDLVKSVIGDEKSAKDNNKRIITRIIFAITLFFVPTIVNIVMNTLSVTGIASEYKTCLDNAKDTEKINVLEEIYKILIESNSEQNIGIENKGKIYTELANKMVTLAKQQVGTQEGTNDENKYGKELSYNNNPWCAIFVTWLTKNTEINGTNIFNNVINKEGKFTTWAGATSTLVHFNKQKHLNFYYSQYYGGNYIPKAGDYIFFNNDKNYTWNKVIDSSQKMAKHVGLVVSTDGTKVYTIEGNSGKPGAVREKEYNLNSKSILGYGSWYSK